MTRILSLLFAGSILIMSCDLLESTPSNTTPDVTIEQGVWGSVKFLEGNFMPPQPTGTARPAERTIHVHEAIHRDQVSTIEKEEWTFYTDVPTKRVTTIRSTQNGFFQAELPPGQYSLFVEEVIENDTLLFANHYDGDGTIHPVKVATDSTQETRIRINYEAVY